MTDRYPTRSHDYRPNIIVSHNAIYVCQTTSAWDGLPTYHDVMDSEKTVVIFDDPEDDNDSKNWETTCPPDAMRPPPPPYRGQLSPPPLDTRKNVKPVTRSKEKGSRNSDPSEESPKTRQASALKEERRSMNSSVTVGGAKARCVSGVWYFDI